MAERIQRQHSSVLADGPSVDVPAAAARSALDYDAIQEETDSVWPADAAQHVPSYVQKGGQ